MKKGKRDGLLIVVSGPAGTGKGTVIRALLEKNNAIKVLPSVTTRNPRKGEKEGYDYYFKSREEFERMIDNDEFVEWVEYCENYYGTPANQLEESLKSGMDIIVEKEVEGAVRIKERYPDSVLIFLLPPSFKELKRRIKSRGTEDSLTIDKRLKRACEELNYVSKYDYVVKNEHVAGAANNIDCIIKAEKLKTCRNVDILKEFLL